MWLLENCQWKESTVVFRGRPRVLKPGQMVTSLQALADGVGMPRANINRLLKSMETEQEVKQEISAASRVISILKWDDYQSGETESETKTVQKRYKNGTIQEERRKNKEGLKDEIEAFEKGEWKERWFWKLAGQEGFADVDCEREYSAAKAWYKKKGLVLSEVRFERWLKRAVATQGDSKGVDIPAANEAALDGLDLAEVERLPERVPVLEVPVKDYSKRRLPIGNDGNEDEKEA